MKELYHVLVKLFVKIISLKNRCKILYLREDDLFCQIWSKKPLVELIKKNQFLEQFVPALKATYSRDMNEFSIQIKSSQQQALEIKNYYQIK